ncbi:hemerythrin domain-containing protein [Azospirillum sp. ST 5-10]|uniref:hemerythrin domain-containing protein n=1 Tax=unclassified Azospirillum TaxID=2630922 RepID=UPI003F49C4E2
MTAQAPRYEIYRLIHKGLRAFMADTLLAVGSLDGDDEAAVADALGRVRGLADFCRRHLEHENGFVHPAMEARAPGSTRDTAGDHEHHEADIEALESAVAEVASRRGAERAAAAQALYRRLCVFVGENLVHMEQEEGRNTAVLWRTHSDEELMALERAIVAAQPPEEQMLGLRWMVAAATPAERAELLGGVRAAVPPEVFGGILDTVMRPLAAADRAKLQRALATPALAA